MELSKEEIREIFQPQEQFGLFSKSNGELIGPITVLEWIKTGEKQTGEYCRMKCEHKKGQAFYRYDSKTLGEYIMTGVLKSLKKDID